jgi:hypothetical protein
MDSRFILSGGFALHGTRAGIRSRLSGSFALPGGTRAPIRSSSALSFSHSIGRVDGIVGVEPQGVVARGAGQGGIACGGKVVGPY